MFMHLRVYSFKVKIFKMLELQMNLPTSSNQQCMAWKGKARSTGIACQTDVLKELVSNTGS